MKPITPKPEISLQIPPHATKEVLTWPGREFDQKGTAPSVEQDHCTLIAVKRYRDPHGLVDGIIFYCDLVYGHHVRTKYISENLKTACVSDVLYAVRRRRSANP